MKKRVIVKGIINYIFAMIFAVIFGLFLDANVGWFILLILILAPVLSVFLAWASAGLLSVSCEMEDALLSKGDTCKMQVRVFNHSIFPTPPIALTLTDEAGVSSENPKMLLSVLSKQEQIFDVEFKAKICGRCVVGIETIHVMDYLGLFSFAVRKINYDTLKGKVSVIPDITEISARDDNLVKVMQSSQHIEDGEDTMETTSYTMGGFPGYDNREYVPGDPLKRINWKQSAKRNKLLVRLDDEMAARSVNVVLDSVFLKKQVDARGVAQMLQYSGLTEKEIIPKMAEDAIEGALGLSEVLIRQGYTVNFFACTESRFKKYELLDEIDLEAVRLMLADYCFAEEENVERIPHDENGLGEKAGVYVTPNKYEQVYNILEEQGGLNSTTVYAVLEEARKQNNEESNLFLLQNRKEEAEQIKLSEKVKKAAIRLALPYFLGLVLSIAMFSVFDVPFLSYWTIIQAVVCMGVVVVCEYVNKHRIIGAMVVTLLTLGLLYTAARLAFNNGLLKYMHWFMSGGESVETTTAYLLSILLTFTCFYAMATYYFTQVLYRTSFLMLVSMIPFIAYVKIMLDIQMVQVAIVTVLNMMAFMVFYRSRRDAGRLRLGWLNEVLSVSLYMVIFVLMGFAVPEAETKYYYIFENLFLGGNVSEAVPEEYSEMSEYSGNADGFNELNDRKLYVITGVEPETELYLNRQSFDLYDFKYDRWYALEQYSVPNCPQNSWYEETSQRSLARLIEAMYAADEYAPGFFEEFGITALPAITDNTQKQILVETTNFPSIGFVTPAKTLSIMPKNKETTPFVTENGIFQSIDGLLDEKLVYNVIYYNEETLQKQFLAAGGSNMDVATSLRMLESMKLLFEEKGLEEYANVVSGYYKETMDARVYQENCAENTAQIPKKVAELAREITKDCTYDWEKAAALQTYFRKNDFVYDLDYRAPDDSVEYFLFKGKTGTCSDYASAYVLMARAVGLSVRYMEGFVPDMEYNGDYVVRTNNGHAYPQVFIPNVGYMTVEATIPASYGNVGGRGGSGIANYFIAVAVRLVLILAAVSAVILTVLFIHLIAAPYIRELYFVRKLKKASPSQASILLYKRIEQKYVKDIIPRAYTMTPYEYAESFEQIFEYDISNLEYQVERAAYGSEELQESDKIKAILIYQEAREAVRKMKKAKKVN